jgi:hypothetical protein
LSAAVFFGGAFLADVSGFWGLVLVAVAFLAGALVAVFVWVVVVFLRAVEDTNTSRQGLYGRGKARCGQEPRSHSATAVVIRTRRGATRNGVPTDLPTAVQKVTGASESRRGIGREVGGVPLRCTTAMPRSDASPGEAGALSCVHQSGRRASNFTSPTVSSTSVFPMRGGMGVPSSPRKAPVPWVAARPAGRARVWRRTSGPRGPAKRSSQRSPIQGRRNEGSPS